MTTQYITISLTSFVIMALLTGISAGVAAMLVFWNRQLKEMIEEMVEMLDGDDDDDDDDDEDRPLVPFDPVEKNNQR